MIVDLCFYGLDLPVIGFDGLLDQRFDARISHRLKVSLLISPLSYQVIQVSGQFLQCPTPFGGAGVGSG